MKDSDTQLTPEYWEKRYQEATAQWDLGVISPPIKEYIDQLSDKSIKILIPGAGNSHEAEYLFRNGFKNVFVADFAQYPLKNIKSRVPDFPDAQLMQIDFFDIRQKFDLIIEQTFFCAIHPSLRDTYVLKTTELLKTGGRIVGLLFDDPLNEDCPPFGGSKEEYVTRFSPFYTIKTMERAKNSVSPRSGRELFINLLLKT